MTVREPLGVAGCVSDPAHTGRCSHVDGTSAEPTQQPPHPTCPDCLDRDRQIWRLAQRAERAEAALRHLTTAAAQLRAVADWLDHPTPDDGCAGQLTLDIDQETTA